MPSSRDRLSQTMSLLCSCLTTLTVVSQATMIIFPRSVRANSGTNNCGFSQPLNQTLLDKLRAQRQLDNIVQRLNVNSSLKPSSLGLGCLQSVSSRLTHEPGGIQSIHNSPTRKEQTGQNGVNWQYDQTKLINEIIRAHNSSEGVGDNILLFPLTEETISASTLVTKIYLYLHILKQPRKSRKNKKMTQSRNPVPTFRDLKLKRKESRAKKRQRKGKMIKIRVFLSDKTGVRGDEIATLKKKFQASRFQKLGLPVSKLGLNSAEGISAGSKLWLRVECKRCTRKNRMGIIYNKTDLSKHCRKTKRRKKRKSNKRRSKKRRDLAKKKKSGKRQKTECTVDEVNNMLQYLPFLMIEEKRKLRPFRSVRSKRSVNNRSMQHANQNEGAQNTGVIREVSRGVSREVKSKINGRVKSEVKIKVNTPSWSPIQNEVASRGKDHPKYLQSLQNIDHAAPCHQKSVYINFHELGLDDVIAPTGFTLTVCGGSCSADLTQAGKVESLMFETVSDIGENEHPVLKSLKSLFMTKLFNIQTPIRNNPQHYISGKPSHRLLNVLHRIVLKRSTKGNLGARVLTVPKFIASRKRRRLKSPIGRCGPIQRQSLVIVHFDQFLNLLVTEMPDFLITNCGCNNN